MHEIFVWITYLLPGGEKKTDCVVVIGGVEELRTALVGFRESKPEGTKFVKAVHRSIEPININ